MKKLSCFALLLFVCLATSAQDEKNGSGRKGQFKKENIFIGGGINIGLGNGSFAVGAIPEVGYSIARWLDAGVVFNLNYQSENNVYDNNGFGPYRIRNFNYGAGTFIRVWPLSFLNLSLQPEYNWIRSNQVFEPTGQKGNYTFKAESLLVGIGYGSREIGRQQTYFNIMVDLLKNVNSPYRDQANRARPIIRTGFGFYLRPSKR